MPGGARTAQAAAAAADQWGYAAARSDMSVEWVGWGSERPDMRSRASSVELGRHGLEGAGRWDGAGRYDQRRYPAETDEPGAQAYLSLDLQERYIEARERHIGPQERHLGALEHYMVAPQDRYLTAQERYMSSQERYMAPREHYMSQHELYMMNRYLDPQERYLRQHQERYVGPHESYLPQHDRYLSPKDHYVGQHECYFHEGAERYLGFRDSYMSASVPHPPDGYRLGSEEAFPVVWPSMPSGAAPWQQGYDGVMRSGLPAVPAVAGAQSWPAALYWSGLQPAPRPQSSMRAVCNRFRVCVLLAVPW